MLKKIILGIVLNGLALYATISVIPEISYTGGVRFFLIGALVLGILNSIVKPFMKIFALPFIIITAGFFLIIVNAGMLWLLEHFVNVIAFRDVSMHVSRDVAYVTGGFVLGVVNWLEHLLIKN